MEGNSEHIINKDDGQDCLVDAALDYVVNMSQSFYCTGISKSLLLGALRGDNRTTGILIKAIHDICLTQLFYKNRNLKAEDITDIWRCYDSEKVNSSDVLEYIHSALDSVFGLVSSKIPIRKKDTPGSVTPLDAIHGFTSVFVAAVYMNNESQHLEQDTIKDECTKNIPQSLESVCTTCLDEVRKIDKLINTYKDNIKTISYKYSSLNNENKLPIEILMSLSKKDIPKLEDLTFYPTTDEKRCICIFCSIIESLTCTVPRISHSIFPIIITRKETQTKNSNIWDKIHTDKMSKLMNKRQELIKNINKILEDRNLMFWESKKP